MKDLNKSYSFFSKEKPLKNNAKININKLDINAVVHKSYSKNRLTFNSNREISQIEQLISAPPSKNEVFKFISGKGGFSSIAVILFVANLEKIESLYASTLRVGKKQFKKLSDYQKAGKIKNILIITSDLQKQVDNINQKYNYFKEIENNKNIDVICSNNHSKIILMKTANNYYVVETSSNLNENPKIEQFSFENNKLVYEFYLDFFNALRKERGRNGST